MCWYWRRIFFLWWLHLCVLGSDVRCEDPERLYCWDIVSSAWRMDFIWSAGGLCCNCLCYILITELYLDSKLSSALVTTQGRSTRQLIIISRNILYNVILIYVYIIWIISNNIIIQNTLTALSNRLSEFYWTLTCLIKWSIFVEKCELYIRLVELRIYKSSLVWKNVINRFHRATSVKLF